MDDGSQYVGAGEPSRASGKHVKIDLVRLERVRMLREPQVGEPRAHLRAR